MGTDVVQPNGGERGRPLCQGLPMQGHGTRCHVVYNRLGRSAPPARHAGGSVSGAVHPSKIVTVTRRESTRGDQPPGWNMRRLSGGSRPTPPNVPPEASEDTPMFEARIVAHRVPL